MNHKQDGKKKVLSPDTNKASMLSFGSLIVQVGDWRTSLTPHSNAANQREMQNQFQLDFPALIRRLLARTFSL